MKTMKRLALLASAAFLASVLMGPSCLKGGKIFSHRKHVVEQELDCDTCHAGSEDGVMAGVPDPEICAACHEEAEKYMEIARKKEQDWPRLKALPPDGIFSHKNHKEAEIGCAACHDDVGKSKVVTFKNMPTERMCIECHREIGVGTDCEVCHKEIRKDVPPKDHSQSWITFHGASMRHPVQEERCYRCHEENTCKSCHSFEKPRDHTAAWREFGHGVSSRIDRNRCATCHRSDFCISCHRETEPLSHHRGGWGSHSDNHCYECHVGGGAMQNCNACHGANLAHRNAPRKPAGQPHNLKVDCRQCHVGALLGHPDNGDNCEICHK